MEEMYELYDPELMKDITNRFGMNMKPNFKLKKAEGPLVIHVESEIGIWFSLTLQQGQTIRDVQLIKLFGSKNKVSYGKYA